MNSLPEYDWNRLEKEAERVVSRFISSLPANLRELAGKVPTLYRQWHPDALKGDAEAAETLGEYLSFEENRVGEGNGPIALYLGAIALYCEETHLDFRDEVRVTYIHELGHHFGWDEDDLLERNLN